MFLMSSRATYIRRITRYTRGGKIFGGTLGRISFLFQEKKKIGSRVEKEGLEKGRGRREDTGLEKMGERESQV